MRFVNEYILKIGQQTALEMKTALFFRLLRLYRPCCEEEFAAYLASAVTNRLFAESPDKPEAMKFLEQNKGLIEKEARALSHDEELCGLLTSAAYSRSYARYASRGGKKGLFSNNFLAYIRSASLSFSDPSYIEIAEKYFVKLEQLDPKILEPIMNLLGLGIFRPLPRNPNEKEIYSRVHAFAIREGVPFKSQS